MSPMRSFLQGKGAGQRQSHTPPVAGPKLQIQAVGFKLPHYPFQPLPPPNGPAPYHFDLSQLLSAADIQNIIDAGVLVFQTVGDTGDYRDSGPQDFVAAMLKQDAENQPADKKPVFFYHLGDVIYFAGD